MDWIEGQTLEEFFINLYQTKDKPKIISQIKENFKKVIEQMDELKIAHGDLSPKNIMLLDDYSIKLVDYDSFFIDRFINSKMALMGDDDCQHPNRKNFRYDHKIDRFSTLVIYLMLSAVQEKPELLEKNKGEFIFKKGDYLRPEYSEIFQQIQKLSHVNRELANTVIQYCKENHPNIEPLGTILKKINQT